MEDAIPKHSVYLKPTKACFDANADNEAPVSRKLRHLVIQLSLIVAGMMHMPVGVFQN